MQNRQTARIWTDAFGAVSVELQLQHDTFPNHDTVLQFTPQRVTRTDGIDRDQTIDTGPGTFSLNTPAPSRTIVFSITPTGAVRCNGYIVQPNTWMVVAP